MSRLPKTGLGPEAVEKLIGMVMVQALVLLGGMMNGRGRAASFVPQVNAVVHFVEIVAFPVAFESLFAIAQVVTGATDPTERQGKKKLRLRHAVRAIIRYK